MSPDPVATGDPIPPRPGDIILIRAIRFWDSGQIQRAFLGLALAAGPVLLDLWDKQALTWRSFISAVMGALFVWMGYSRAKSPDVVTGIKALDRANAAAVATPPAGPKAGG